MMAQSESAYRKFTEIQRRKTLLEFYILTHRNLFNQNITIKWFIPHLHPQPLEHQTGCHWPPVWSWLSCANPVT
jgi:hypothetical protein